LIAGCAFLVVTLAIVAGPNLDIIDPCIRSRLNAGVTTQLGIA
jgi:hypothetical protein